MTIAYMVPNEALNLIRGLTHPDGRTWADALAGDSWLWDDVLSPILARNDAGLPLHRLVWAELARGHIKTNSAAAVAIAESVIEDQTQVYALAADFDQARFLTEAIEGQRQRSAKLAAVLLPAKDGYAVKGNGSRIRVMSSDAPSFFGAAVNARRLRIICDELTQWSSRALFDAALTTLPKVRDAQLLVITNAGVLGSWQEDAKRAAEVSGYVFAPAGVIASWIAQADLDMVRLNVPEPTFRRFYLNEWLPETSEAIFKAEWFRWYDEEPEKPDYSMQAWDTAFSSRTTADYSVGQTWLVGPDGYYLRDLHRGRLEFPALKAAIGSQFDLHQPAVVVVEEAASGRSILQELQASTLAPVIGFTPEKDKVTRAWTVTPLFESSHVFFPRSAPWLRDFLSELGQFPGGRHDDQVDSMVMALTHMAERFRFDRRNGSTAELLRTMQRMEERRHDPFSYEARAARNRIDDEGGSRLSVAGREW